MSQLIICINLPKLVDTSLYHERQWPIDIIYIDVNILLVF